MRRPSRSRAQTPAPFLVVAAAGYGKTAWAEGLLPAEGRVVRAEEVTPGGLAATLAGGAPSTLVVEDLHLLESADQADLVRDLAGLPSGNRVILTSRQPLEPKVRSLLTGPLYERGPADLALSPASVAAVLAEEYGVTDAEVPSTVHALTAGWPTLVHLAADAVSSRPGDDVAAALGRPGSASATWLENDVLSDLTDELVDLLALAAGLDVLTPELLDHVRGGEGDSPWVSQAFDRMVRMGLLTRHPRTELVGRDGYRLVPVLRSLLRASGRNNLGAGSAEHLVRAGEWYQQRGLPFAAVEAFARAGQRPRAELLLAERGPEMIAHGDAAGIVTFLNEGGADDLGPAARRTLGEALNLSGHSYAALGAFAPLIEAAERDGWDVGLATRVAAVHYSQGEIPEAREILERVPSASLTARGDGVLWRATRVNVASMLGEDGLATALAAEALGLAERSGDPFDLSAAHQAVAKISSGSRKGTHLRLALAAARESGDAVSVARILGNQAFALLAAARCEEAAVVSREAVQAAELVRPVGALIAALHNLAEALSRVGEYGEARWHLRRSAAFGQRLGPNRAASSLCGLGEVHRALGQREQGRAAYEEAITLARSSHELQVLVPALGGLARLMLDDAPDAARTAAEEAVELAPASLAPYALIALGWVERAAGNRERAATLATQAATAARGDQALDLVADALELAAEVEDHPDRARQALTEALSIWRAGGADPDASRIEVLLGRLEDADRATRARGREAAERLQRLGVTRVNGRTFGDDPVAKSISIAVLGRFEVTVGGQPVPLQAWKSRQARTLVKILAGRRGRPVARAHLCELLWPDDDPVKTSHRLSVLLTTVRTVLDPAKSWPADHFVASDTRGVWLDLRRVSIDADELLADAEHGATLLTEGQDAAATDILASVDSHYRGEAFEDEPYEEWAESLREETRAAWLRSLRHLATLATKDGRSNDASAILVRLLSVDPYDERVHRGLVRNLVRAGRHGEARRAFDRWTDAMTAVDAPRPDRTELVPRPRSPQ